MYTMFSPFSWRTMHNFINPQNHFSRFTSTNKSLFFNPHTFINPHSFHIPYNPFFHIQPWVTISMSQLIRNLSNQFSGVIPSILRNNHRQLFQGFSISFNSHTFFTLNLLRQIFDSISHFQFHITSSQNIVSISNSSHKNT